MTQLEIMELLGEVVTLFPHSKMNYKTPEALDDALQTFEKVLDGVTYDEALGQLYAYARSKPKYPPMITDLLPDPEEPQHSVDATIPGVEETKINLERIRREREERRRNESQEEREALQHEFIERARDFGGRTKRDRKIVIDLTLDESRRD